MALNRKQFLASSTVSEETVTVTLPDGREVLLLRPTGRILREHRRSMRQPDGRADKNKIGREPELLLARLLIDEDTNQPMFTTDEVLHGAFDDVLGPDIEFLTDACYSLAGFGKYAEETAAKNSDPTGENDSSGSSSVEPG